MVNVTKELRDAVSIISASTGIFLTEEQRDVVYNFNNSMAVFANPGTGKTTTVVAGLLAAQTVHGIRGSRINAMSFTRLATAELAARYDKACKRCGLSPNVSFNTFHSICYSIIREVYPDFEIRSKYDYTVDLNNFKEMLRAEQVDRCDDMYFVRKVFNAMNSLNNELRYAKDSVLSASSFINISDGISLIQFQKVRARWFRRAFISKSIHQGEIPTMVLYILNMRPELGVKYKEKYDLMVVDEFQDMSILYLEVLSRICNKLIVVGDLKQQIYAFNGASLLILDAFKKMYEDACYTELTQSFRCCDEIVNLANTVIAPNEIEGWENFKGRGSGGIVDIKESDGESFESVVNTIKENQDNKVTSDIMFLARNNSSVIPIIEQLYQKGIFFRTTSLKLVTELPIFKDLCVMADVALNSSDPEQVAKVNRFMPEFKRVPASKNPLIEVMNIASRPADLDLLTMNFQFNMDSSIEIINKLNRFKFLNEQGQPLHISFQPLIDVYEEYVIRGEWWRLENTKEYYFNLVSSILKNKTYQQMVYEENDKRQRNEYYCKIREGVRCYTFHSSKGLEAETVYLLDVDEGIIPLDKSIMKLVDDGCVLDAAKEIRNERNLLYVAITRCKKHLNILYNGNMSVLLSNPNQNGYAFLDTIWKERATLNDECRAFKLLLGVRDNAS